MKIEISTVLFLMMISDICYSGPLCVEKSDTKFDCKSENGERIIFYGGSIYCCNSDIEGVKQVYLVKQISNKDKLIKQYYPKLSIYCDETKIENLPILEDYKKKVRECVLHRYDKGVAFGEILFDQLIRVKVKRINSGFFKGGALIEAYENESYSLTQISCGEEVIKEFLRDFETIYENNKCSEIELVILYVDDFPSGFYDIELFHKKIKTIEEEIEKRKLNKKR